LGSFEVNRLTHWLHDHDASSHNRLHSRLHHLRRVLTWHWLHLLGRILARHRLHLRRILARHSLWWILLHTGMTHLLRRVTLHTLRWVALHTLRWVALHVRLWGVALHLLGRVLAGHSRLRWVALHLLGWVLARHLLLRVALRVLVRLHNNTFLSIN
jgi:hypothetical protein